MFISLEWDILLKMRFLLSKIMFKMTHIHNINQHNCFQIPVADSFKCKTDDKKLYYIPSMNFLLFCSEINSVS